MIRSSLKMFIASLQNWAFRLRKSSKAFRLPTRFRQDGITQKERQAKTIASNIMKLMVIQAHAFASTRITHLLGRTTTWQRLLLRSMALIWFLLRSTIRIPMEATLRCSTHSMAIPIAPCCCPTLATKKSMLLRLWTSLRSLDTTSRFTSTLSLTMVF